MNVSDWLILSASLPFEAAASAEQSPWHEKGSNKSAKWSACVGMQAVCTVGADANAQH